MKTATKTTAAAISVLGMLLLGACSDPNEGTEPTAAPTLTAQETSSPESSSEPGSPAPEETEGPMATPEVGDIVAAENIEQARDLGAAVYVSPTGDGSGVAIDPDGETPEAIIRDVEATPTPLGSLDDVSNALTAIVELNEAVIASGAGAFMLTEAPLIEQGQVVGTLYVVRPFGEFPQIDEFKSKVGAHESKSAAIADAQPYMDANPNFTFVDATD